MPQGWHVLLFEQSLCAGIAKALDHKKHDTLLHGYRQTVSERRKGIENLR
jgi:hypothetical protein